METSADFLDVTLERILAVWWSFVWRSAIFTMLLGVVLGFGGGIIVGAAGHPELGGAVGALLGWLASIPVSIAVLGKVLGKQFNGFRIRLVRTEPRP